MPPLPPISTIFPVSTSTRLFLIYVRKNKRPKLVACSYDLYTAFNLVSYDQSNFSCYDIRNEKSAVKDPSATEEDKQDDNQVPPKTIKGARTDQ